MRTWFSAGAIFGGSRLLQAIARDGLFPFLKPFSYGSQQGDEPRVAVLLSWAIGTPLLCGGVPHVISAPAQACLFIGSLDIIAPVITSFFCLAYSLVNLTCLLLSVTGNDVCVHPRPDVMPCRRAQL